MYHVEVDNDVPYHIYGNMQDDGTMRGLSNSPEVERVPGDRPAGGAGAVRRIGRGFFGPWDHGPGRLRIRLHASRPHRYQHRVGHLLRR